MEIKRTVQSVAMKHRKMEGRCVVSM